MTKKELLKKIKIQKQHKDNINLLIKNNKTCIKIFKGFIKDCKERSKKGKHYCAKAWCVRTINRTKKELELNKKLLKESKQKIKTLKKEINNETT